MLRIHRNARPDYATREIKRDMESLQPMDRLLCGDVGFGKTEVVMRATFKRSRWQAGGGPGPTTVLAFQHFETFKRRFQPFPCAPKCSAGFALPRNSKRL